jgi:pimeloyl-ACP methyl ester carboxylesterase
MKPLLTELDQRRSYETYTEYQQYREAIAALAELAPVSIAGWPVLSEQAWRGNPVDDEARWNPIAVIEQTKIPVLAIFGDQDRNIDPQQGAYAYRTALELGGNPKSKVAVFPQANHGIIVSETGCPEEDMRLLEQYAKSLGYESLSEAQEALQNDPGLMSIIPFAPGFLDTIEEWLKNLPEYDLTGI